MTVAISTSVFHAEGLLQRLNNDLEHAIDLIAMYQHHSPQMLQDVRQAVDGNDAEAVRSASHRLKGAALHMHAEVVTELALKLERLGQFAELSEAAGTLRELEQHHAGLLTSLSEFCAAQTVSAV